MSHHANSSNNLRIIGISAAVTIALSGAISIGLANAHLLGFNTTNPAAPHTDATQSQNDPEETSANDTQSTPATTPEATLPAEPEPIPQPSVDCHISACIALTFDDGPHQDYTPQILNTLKEKQVRATFFQLGRNIEGNEALLKRAHQEGHILATHTWDHPQLPLLPDADIQAQILNTKKVSEAASGVKTTLMRPPYGLFNDAVLNTLASTGDSLIMWDVDTEDWKNKDAAETTQRALAGAHPGAIILMHDIHPSTAQALPGIIDGLRAAGYTLVDIPTILGEMKPAEIYYTGLEPQPAEPETPTTPSP